MSTITSHKLSNLHPNPPQKVLRPPHPSDDVFFPTHAWRGTV